MDLLNAAVFHLDRQGVGVILDRCSGAAEVDPLTCRDAVATAELAVSRFIPSTKRPSATQGYFYRLFSMFGFMGSVAMGPNGPHSHFLQHSVDALTIRGLGRSEQGLVDNGGGGCSLFPLGGTGSILSIIRGISNLEEELHHSFFAYLMLSTRSFVSIGACLFIPGPSLWLVIDCSTRF